MTQWQSALLVVAIQLCGADSAPAAAIDIGGQRQLFVDDWIVDQTQNIQRQPAEVVKNPGNPVLKRDKPWDQCRCDIYGSGVFDRSHPLAKQRIQLGPRRPVIHHDPLRLPAHHVGRNQGRLDGALPVDVDQRAAVGARLIENAWRPR